MSDIKLSDLAVRVLALVRLDSQRLFDRIKYRAPEYLTIYSTKRTRDHYAAIFNNKYDDIKIEDLKLCTEGVIEALDQFYASVDKLRWYLYTTEDMPNKVDDKVHGVIKALKKDFDKLANAIDLQRGVVSQAQETTSTEEVLEMKVASPPPKERPIFMEEPKQDVNDFTLRFDFNSDSEATKTIQIKNPKAKKSEGIKFDMDNELSSIKNLEVKKK